MRGKFFLNIDLALSKIKPYEGFIFLCGGPTDIRSHLPLSVRDAIYRELSKDTEIDSRIRVAEHYKDWSSDSIYQDLVLFEQHLAELSSVIVLILESPGSIAELGLFSVVSEFQEKLLVFVDTSHYTSNSFIRLGPISHLEKISNNSAHCYRWLSNEEHPKFDPAAAVALQPDLKDAVLERITRPAKEHLFKFDKWLDFALLLCDVLNINSALTLREIKDILASLNCLKSEKELRQALFILEKVELITMEPSGEQRFYLSVGAGLYLKYHVEGKSADLDRLRYDILTDYSVGDKKRFRAIQNARRRYARPD